MEAEKMEEIQKQLEDGVREIYSSGRYKNFLDTMLKFHDYSLNNTLLIASQRPDATHVSGFVNWQKDFHRYVKKGETGIMILSPQKFKKYGEAQAYDKNHEPVFDENGNPKMEKRLIEGLTFRPNYVYDISQTDGKPLPEIAEKLEFDVENYEKFKDAIMKISPSPISFKNIEGTSNGCFIPSENRIVVQKGMSEAQTLKTMIHEVSHASLKHGTGECKFSRKEMEVQAESISYCVLKNYGIDSSNYTFGYIAGWSADKEMEALISNLEIIKDKSSEIINNLDLYLQPEKIEKEFLNSAKNKIAIYQIKDDVELEDYKFNGISFLEKNGLNVEKENYNLVYVGDLYKNESLDDIFERFNLHHPENYKGHSLSVSDIVVQHRNKVNIANFVDSFGFEEIKNFIPQKETAARKKAIIK